MKKPPSDMILKRIKINLKVLEISIVITIFLKYVLLVMLTELFQEQQKSKVLVTDDISRATVQVQV